MFISCVVAVDCSRLVYLLAERCVGFMMAKMILRELMDPAIFMKFKSFLNKVCKLIAWDLISYAA